MGHGKRSEILRTLQFAHLTLERFLSHLDGANRDANPELMRLALKLAAYDLLRADGYLSALKQRGFDVREP